jgi:hypothetical protein
VNIVARHYQRRAHHRALKDLRREKKESFRHSLFSTIVHQPFLALTADFAETTFLRPVATKIAVLLTSIILAITLVTVWIFGYTIVSFSGFYSVYVLCYIIGLIWEYTQLIWYREK